MSPKYLSVLCLSALVVLLAVACGGGGSSEAPITESSGSASDDAWVALLQERGFDTEERDVEIGGSVDGSDLVLQIEVDDDAPGEVQVLDGLYGAEAYTYADGAWTRVDTADARPLSAPVLAPGESAEVTLPVEAADSYRVLVPVTGTSAAWADIG